MTVRRVIRCNTCGKDLVIKIQVPNSDYERFDFSCPNCKESLSYEISTKGISEFFKNRRVSSDVMKSLSSSFGLNAVSNCKDVSDEKENCSIEEFSGFEPIYLSKEIPNDIGQFSSFPYSPAPMYFARKLYERKGIIDKAKVLDGWKRVYSIFRQYSQGNTEYKESLIKDFQKLFCVQGEEDYGMNDCLFEILHYLVAKVTQYDSSIMSLFSILSRFDKPKVLSFANYLRKEYRKMSPSIMEVCNEFFSKYNELHLFLQNMSDSNSFKNLSYPFDFDRSLLHIYGSLYEKLADMLLFYSCFINLEQGRGFDCFENSKKTLDSYKQSDKSSRIYKVYKKNPDIKFLTEEYDSDIRNATHHSNSAISFENNELVLQRKDNTPAKVISHKEYLNRTATIFMEFASLLCLWLLVIQHGESLKKAGVLPG